VVYPQTTLGGGRSSDAERMSLEGGHRFQGGPLCMRCNVELWLLFAGDAPEWTFEHMFGFTFALTPPD